MEVNPNLSEKARHDYMLVKLAIAGDQKAYAELLGRYRDAIYFMLLKMVNNKSLPLIDRWEILEPFWQATRNTGYARVVIIAARDLYGIKDINAESVEQLSRKINDSYQTGWYKKVLKDNAKIDLSIVDVGHVKPDHEFYYHVERFDRFISVFSASEINDLGKKYEVEIYFPSHDSPP